MTLTEKRMKKFPNTDTFQYYNANPKNKITTDCVIRAVCTVLQKPYNEVVMDMAKLQCETGFDDGDLDCIDRYMKSQGWIRCKQPKKPDGKKYRGVEFCRKLVHPIYSEELTLYPKGYDFHRVLADIGGHHIVAIIEGKVHDIWNSTGGSIGVVWVKPAT